RCDAPGFHDDQFPTMNRLLASFLRERGIAEPLAWLDTPAALPLAEALRPREERLLQLADIVLAGGPSLYESLRRRHANVHCVANAVDAEHFAPPPSHSKAIEAVSA